MTWKTKPTDRFVLRLIKLYFSAPITMGFLNLFPNIRPAIITFLAAGIGMGGGLAFGLGYAFLGALMAACAQILDGVDGQIARYTKKESSKGAMLDSFLDRYMDISLLFGVLLHCLRYSADTGQANGLLAPGWLVFIAALAAAGSSQISYATARAASLNLTFKRPELAGKGSRTTVIIVCGLLTPFWIHFPLVALAYLAVHPNIAVAISIVRLLKTDTR